MTPLVVASATPLTATWPPAVMVHWLPDASVIAAVDPAGTTVLSGDAVGAAAGTGLVAVPPGGSHPAPGDVSLHHKSAEFSCQISPFS